MKLRRADYLLLMLILVITAIKGEVWGIAVPLWQGPDENRHFSTTQFVAERGRLPGIGDVYRDDENVIVGELTDVARLWYAPEQRQAFGNGLFGPRETEVEALDPVLRTSTTHQAQNIANHLSPLYYLLGVPVYRLVYGASLIVRVFAVRQLSVACGVATVACAFLIARQIFPNRRAMWFTVPVLVSFHPQFTFLTSVVSSDAMLALVYTLLLYCAARGTMRGWGWGLAALTGAVLGIGVLTKPTILGALPMIVVAVTWDAWRERRWLRMLGVLALIGAVSLAVCAWWLWRSVQLSGTLLYANPVKMGILPVDRPYHEYPLLRYVWHYAGSLVGGVFVGFWADFGWIDTPLSPEVYWLLLAVCALAATSMLVYLVRGWRNPQQRCHVVALGVLLLNVPTLVAMFGIGTYRTWIVDGIGWGGVQGRYFLGVLVAVQVALALGLTWIVPHRWRPASHLVLRWGAVVLNLVCLFAVLLPRYYL